MVLNFSRRIAVGRGGGKGPTTPHPFFFSCHLLFFFFSFIFFPFSSFLGFFGMGEGGGGANARPI